MEMSLNNGFCEMSQDEVMDIEGGGIGHAIAGLVVLAFVVCSTKGCADADAGK